MDESLDMFYLFDTQSVREDARQMKDDAQSIIENGYDISELDKEAEDIVFDMFGLQDKKPDPSTSNSGYDYSSQIKNGFKKTVPNIEEDDSDEDVTKKVIDYATEAHDRVEDVIGSIDMMLDGNIKKRMPSFYQAIKEEDYDKAIQEIKYTSYGSKKENGFYKNNKEIVNYLITGLMEKQSRTNFEDPEIIDKNDKLLKDPDFHEVSNDVITNKTINIAEGTAGIHIPISSKKTLKAGVTIGSVDLAFGGKDQINKAMTFGGLTEEEKNILKPFIGVHYSSDKNKQREFEKKAIREIPEALGQKMRNGLVLYNQEKVFNRLGKPGNFKTKEQTVWNKLNTEEKAAIIGMRIKNQNIDYVLTDKNVVDKKSLILLIKKQMKNFNAVDTGNWNKYIKVLEKRQG